LSLGSFVHVGELFLLGTSEVALSALHRGERSARDPRDARRFGAGVHE